MAITIDAGDHSYATAWLYERAGAETTNRAQLVADGLAVRLRDACDRILAIRKRLIGVIVAGVAEEERVGEAGARIEIARKELAGEIWELLGPPQDVPTVTVILDERPVVVPTIPQVIGATILAYGGLDCTYELSADPVGPLGVLGKRIGPTDIVEIKDGDRFVATPPCLGFGQPDE